MTHESLPTLGETLKAERTWPWTSQGKPRVHVFEDDDIKAVDAAMGAGRPLLLLGEPGAGKTQLAEAVAAVLKCPFVIWTVDARTEPGDLLYRVDHVERLAHAQCASFLPGTPAKPGEREQSEADASRLMSDHVRKLLEPRRFVIPGPLWWGLDWEGAKTLARAELPERAEAWRPKGRVAVLIDEIDKADPAVPNGLLEALGSDRFRGPDASVQRDPTKQAPPLVFVTSNDERDLPDAFLRRCVVHVLKIDVKDQIKFFTDRGAPHFKDLSPKVLRSAAEDLVEDRKGITEGPRPGLAEYLDLLRVLNGSKAPARETPNQREKRLVGLLENVRPFIFQKFANIAKERQERGR